VARADARTALVSITGAAGGLLPSSGGHSASAVEAETLWQHLFDSAAALDVSQVCLLVLCGRRCLAGLCVVATERWRGWRHWLH